ncbi:MAG: NAD-dependent epimerase/dehydratase family protein [Desulfobacula sp.]|jgi:nucleoside-diphosphate-sugar epimerase|nr:NAD-dependent epimerase/dehydratase family protein [Desulfobacula sp.]
MKTILVTGAAGFIGQAVCQNLLKNFKVIAFDRNPLAEPGKNYIPVKGNILDKDILQSICTSYSPDVVVHCAGIAHQNIFKPLEKAVYENINSFATKNLAKIVSRVNSKVQFIFLSSISVYGETAKKSRINETADCQPTSDYAFSKLNGEIALKKIYDDGFLNKIDIFRLAPVYDKIWSVNLEKRVFGPQKMFYLKFGSGKQRMSILSRQNLVDFIRCRIEKLNGPSFNVFNVCDEKTCSFNEIIHVFQNSKFQPNKMIVKIPLFFIRCLTKGAGLFFPHRAAWINSFYNKLANSLVFDNKRMLDTGFCPKQSLCSVFGEVK